MKDTLKFSIRRCLDYITSINDFTIEFERKPSYDDSSSTINYIAERLKVKAYLKRFLMECKKESVKDDYDFIKWLGDRKLHWKNQQYRIIGSLNDRLVNSNAEERQEVERKINRYGGFFGHIYKLIEMIENEVMNNLERMPEAPPSDNTRCAGFVILRNNKSEGLQILHSGALERKQHDASISCFDQLFNEGRCAERYYQLLRDHEYPLIGSEYNYMSRALKSGFCIWIYELQRQHVIRYQPDKEYATLLVQKITGLKSFHYTLFGKTNNKAEERYKEYFAKKIAEVKEACGK